MNLEVYIEIAEKLEKLDGDIDSVKDLFEPDQDKVLSQLLTELSSKWEAVYEIVCARLAEVTK